MKHIRSDGPRPARSPRALISWMLSTQPAMLSTQPAMLVTQPAMLSTQPAMLVTQPAMLSTQPAMLVPQRTAQTLETQRGEG